MNHTPGPWGVSSRDLDGRADMVVAPPVEECHRRVEAGEMPFTTVRICLCANDSYMTAGEVAANARLIAAAPDLLAAAERVLRATHALDDLYEAIRDVRDACRKAKGD